MKCRQARLKISLLFDGRLSEAKNRELEAHLKVCRGCRAEAETMRVMVGGIESLPHIEPRDGGWENLSRRMEESTQARRRFSPVYAFACVLAIVVVLAVVFLPHGGRHVAEVQRPEPIRVVEDRPQPTEPPEKTVEPQASAPVQQTPERPAAVAQPEVRSVRKVAAASEKNVRPIAKRVKKPVPIAPLAPASEEPESLPEENEEYYAESEPVQPNDISYDADRLLAQGLSVLVEASAAQAEGQGGDHL